MKPIKPIMSDAQYRAMTSVIIRDGADVVRYLDGSVTTLLAMARPGRRWVDIVWGTVDGKRQITSATVRRCGLTAYEAETERRKMVAADEARKARIIGTPAAAPAPTRTPRVSITAAVDPFALFSAEPALPF